jgi:lipoprotein signal peptidase
MKSKEFIILSGIVLFDLITKLIANYYLPFQEDVYVFGEAVSLYLTYNESSAGAQAQYLAGDSNLNVTIILVCLSGLILLSFFFYMRKKKIRTIYKVLIGIALYSILSVLVQTVPPLLMDVTVPSWPTSVIAKLTGLTLYGTLFYLSRNKWIRLFSVFILACGIGNLLSHFYLPFSVIDFINIKGSYDLLRIGVFNFADLAFDIGAIGLIISIGFVSLKRLITRQALTVPAESNPESLQ